jgi:hypothetical protein
MSFKENELEDSEKTQKLMYTYAVNMIVSVFAEDEAKALKTLNENGGFVSHRDVKLKDSVEIYRPEED